MSEEVDKLKKKIERLQKRVRVLEESISYAHNKLTASDVNGALEILEVYLPYSPD